MFLNGTGVEQDCSSVLQVDLTGGESTFLTKASDQVWAGPDFRQSTPMQRHANLIEPQPVA